MFTFIVSAGFVLTGIVNTLIGPLLPILAVHWALSDAQAGYFFVAQFLGSIAGVSLSSFMIPRSGFRFTIGLSYVLMAVGVIGLQASEWRYALLGAVALGIGFGVAIPATNLFVSYTNPYRRASALSLLNFYWGLGAVFTPVAIYLATPRNHISLFLTLLSVLLLCSTGSLAFASSENFSIEKKEIGPSSQQSEWRFIVIVGAMFFLYVAIEATAGGWIATLAKRASATPNRQWIFAPSMFWGGLLAGRGLAPQMLQRFRERHIAIAGLMAAAMGICVLIIKPEWQWITAAGLVIGFGLSAVFPITVALLSRFQHIETARAGPMFALAGLGGAIMPWLTGFVSTWSGSLRIGLTVPLIGTVILLWLHIIGNHASHTIETQIT
jgi:fucose permease